MSIRLPFQPKARLLLQLGDQLIRSGSIALLELIKNSYDANASKVRVTMKNVEVPQNGRIIIEDNGIGMDSNIIKNVWMQPGSDYKQKIVQSLKVIPQNGRIPIGEKGIGRFGAHKLGYQIHLVSKMSGKKEVSIKIDWKEFEKDDFLNKIEIPFTERKTPHHFTNGKTGTRIVIKELRNAWTRGTIRELYRAVNSLSSPFDSLDSFKVYFRIDNQEWLAGLLSFKDIKKYALYYGEATIKNNKIELLNYEFRPWDTMKKLRRRNFTDSDVRMVERIRDDSGKRKWVDLDLSEFKIGEIRFKIMIFDRDNRILSLGVTDKKGFKEYLDINGGVRVFRNGIRVYDYGELSNDWLNLDIMRVNQPGETISNNLVIGAVYLDRIESEDLEEKTNREGFVENEAYLKFASAARFALGQILDQRNIDKEKVREYYSSRLPKEPVIGNVQILRDKITEKISDKKFQRALLRTIDNIEKDYRLISEIYIMSSSAGLSLGIVIHEVEKIIDELIKAVEEIPSQKHIVDLVRILHKTVSDYAGIIKQSSKSKENLVEVIDQALSNIQYRIKAHKLDIIRKYKERRIDSNVRCNFNLIISTIINIIDNSIWWLNYDQVKMKKIFIDITEDHPGYLSVLIADN
ncbi:ATP-binding protein, partial [Patescibacteria group bacterium]|nr:ATP-binding protein [Patescibacteria group bacterium]